MAARGIVTEVERELKQHPNNSQEAMEDLVERRVNALVSHIAADAKQQLLQSIRDIQNPAAAKARRDALDQEAKERDERHARGEYYPGELVHMDDGTSFHAE